MALFSLVHRGQHGAWCFDLLIPELNRMGHQAIAVDLPIGDPAAGAQEYAQVVVDSLTDVHDEVVLVGHSLGGWSSRWVALQRPVSRLVFLCAGFPEVGMSHFQSRAEHPDEGVGGGARASGRRRVTPTWPPSWRGRCTTTIALARFRTGPSLGFAASIGSPCARSRLFRPGLRRRGR